MAGPVSSGLPRAWQGIGAEPPEGHYVAPDVALAAPHGTGQRHRVGGPGSRHSRSLLGLLRALLCALEAAARPASTHPGQQQWLPGRGGCDSRRARPAWPGQPGPGLNGALCGQQSHLSPPPLPSLPSWGHSVAFIPAWPKAESWGGGVPSREARLLATELSSLIKGLFRLTRLPMAAGSWPSRAPAPRVSNPPFRVG